MEETNIPKVYDPQSFEKKWYQYWYKFINKYQIKNIISPFAWFSAIGIETAILFVFGVGNSGLEKQKDNSG